MSLLQKQAKIERYIRKVRYSPNKFLARQISTPSTRIYRTKVDIIIKALPNERLVSLRVLQSEAKRLIGKELFFRKYNLDKSIDKVNLVTIEDIIKNQAPGLYTVLRYLLPNQRKSLKDLDKITDPKEEPILRDRFNRIRKRISTIVYVIVRSITLKSAS